MNKETNCACGCGAHDGAHAEHEGCSCGCGGHHGAAAHHHDEMDTPTKTIVNAPATAEQLDFLRVFDAIAPLPIVKYLVKSSVEHSFESVALSDVCLRSGEDSIACIKETAAFLQGLEASNLIAIDYENYLEDTAYQHYFTSDSYQLLEDTVSQGKERADFLGDYVTLEKGCIGMTAWGKAQLDAQAKNL